VKTLAHELGHALLHEDANERALAELEAESVAFVVCDAVGLASDDYSFGYVATWVGGDADSAEAALRASGGRITRAARTVLDEVSGSLEANPEGLASTRPCMDVARADPGSNHHCVQRCDNPDLSLLDTRPGGRVRAGLLHFRRAARYDARRVLGRADSNG
jgi:hypothetical protein